MSQADANAVPLPDAPIDKPKGKYRWIICGLLFFATTVNYMDRAVLGILEPTMQKEFGWTKAEYGNINAMFQLMYGVGFLVMGWVIDRIGVRKGFSIGVIVWSLASMAHGWARGVTNLMWARGVLGLGESVNFPCAIKAVADWFPKKERALATGIFNAGSNVALTLVPLIVPLLVHYFDWRAAFFITGATGFIWLMAWLLIYRDLNKHSKVTAEEIAYIRSGQQEETVDSGSKVRWRDVMSKKQTWVFGIGKFLTDPAWWFFLIWLPPILHEKFDLNLKDFAAPLVVVYLMADVGSICGGWLSSYLLKKGFSANFSRKLTMFICALCVTPLGLVPFIDDKWTAILIIGVAAGAHQGWSANLFTLVSDTFPRRAVGSVVGIGGLLGSIGGYFFPKFVGSHWDATKSYALPLIMIACVYLITLLLIHIINPRLAPARVRE